MTKIEIKSIFGNVLFTYEAENATIKDAVEKAVKEKVSLRSADLSSANLSSANLILADLSLADLSSANLRSADLSSADLSLANLSSADLILADLRSADLSLADLSSANLRSANLSSAKNKETAYLPLFCKWNYAILGDKIKIGCKTKNILEWNKFFESSEEYGTKRNTQEFKQIHAVYNACKAYLLTLNQE
jgi:hypothetical protein